MQTRHLVVLSRTNGEVGTVKVLLENTTQRPPVKLKATP